MSRFSRREKAYLADRLEKHGALSRARAFVRDRFTALRPSALALYDSGFREYALAYPIVNDDNSLEFTGEIVDEGTREFLDLFSEPSISALSFKNALAETPGDIRLIINSPGGDVWGDCRDSRRSRQAKEGRRPGFYDRFRIGRQRRRDGLGHERRNRSCPLFQSHDSSRLGQLPPETPPSSVRQPPTSNGPTTKCLPFLPLEAVVRSTK